MEKGKDPKIEYTLGNIKVHRGQVNEASVDENPSPSDIIIQQVGSTTLTATATATAHNTEEFTWSITKSATPTVWNLFNGDLGTSQYTVSVVKSQGTTDKAFIEGEVCVTNAGVSPTEDLQINLDIQIQPNTSVLTGVPVDVSSYPIIPAGETHCYPYSVIIPSGSVMPGATYKVTANVTIMNHAGHEGTPFGPSPSDTTVMPDQQTIVNDTIHVTDDGSSYTFSDSAMLSYSVKYQCPDDAGTHTNTAVIEETGQSASATVTVNCYALQVSKDVNTALIRTYNWDITKTADKSNITLSTGQSLPVNYTVTVSETSVDSGWAVSGNITVHNPAPIDAVINSITDIISPNIAATAACGVSFPYTLAAGGTLNCTYSANLPNGDERTNTATAILQNFDYGFNGTSVPDGTTEFIGTATINFSNATITEVNKCVTVEDTLQGILGNLCVGVDNLPKTFVYTRQIGPFATCGEFEVTNTASVINDEGSVLAHDEWTVHVHIPCRGLMFRMVNSSI
ncbi:hypothetical protein HBE96_15425 [Clostridium sp. P21]|uniref:Uncharacterized protein n=1 Tax=Clostridium muellerianum TaxID=2716538 RepID=A0A7Y0HPT1_9CLOT|nr:hypothetical protein [Clostridium muellerianum]NMM64037.1 hypothetical protein [Clostridium muellerianum]